MSKRTRMCTCHRQSGGKSSSTTRQTHVDVHGGRSTIHYIPCVMCSALYGTSPLYTSPTSPSTLTTSASSLETLASSTTAVSTALTTSGTGVVDFLLELHSKPI